MVTMCIISLKYSPVHNDHCLALGEPLRTQGYDVRYLLSKKMVWITHKEQSPFVNYLGTSKSALQVAGDTLALYTLWRKQVVKYLSDLHPSVIIFESSHPANALIAKIAKEILKRVSIFVMLHEPYVHDKMKHGFMRVGLIKAHEFGTRMLLPLTDGVILMSDEALSQMETAYPHYMGMQIRIPLLFEDRSIGEASPRRYFTFVGHAVPAKGIDQFLEFVDISAGAHKEWQFQIVTSTDISEYLQRLTPIGRENLHIVNKRYLRDEEIDQAICNSWAVLAPYRRVTQSGVVPVAFMHGTPVISTRVGGMPESVHDGETGYLVDNDALFEAWEEKFIATKENFDHLSASCRRYYLDHFDSHLSPMLLKPVLDSVSGQ